MTPTPSIDRSVSCGDASLQQLEHPTATPGGNKLAYAILWQMVATQVALGLSVIADSPLSYPIGYDRAKKRVCRYDARLLVVETSLAADEWQRRLAADLVAQVQRHMWDGGQDGDQSTNT
jgi:hypothetical protein